MAAPAAAVAPEDKYVIGKNGEKRLKGLTLTIPVVTGTVAFYLGKKATEYQSHKWTVYMRSARGEDLSWLLQKATFVLHESFQSPARDLEYAPYEVTEMGWGEFDIVVKLHFHEDVGEPPVELYHRLRLYDETGQNNQKKPVVHENYDEVVLWEPTEAVYARATMGPPQAAPQSQLAQFHTAFNPELEYQRIQRARQRVAQIAHSVQRNLAQLEASAAEAGLAT